MRNNWTIIVAVVLAVVTATLAIVFRPARKTGEWEPMATTSTTLAETTCESSTQTRKTEPSRASTTKEVKRHTETETSTEATTESTTRVNKFVSRLQEIVERDREWLSEHEHTTQMTPSEFRRAGVVYYNGYKFTYYSEKVLPGPDLKIPGRHSDGNFVRDGDDYICVASCDLPKGTVVDTPFGEGKVYDVCGQSGTIDIYVSF